MGPAVPRHVGPVRPRSTIPARRGPARHTIRSISFVYSRCSPSLAASACPPLLTAPGAVASDGYKNFVSTPTRESHEALFNFSSFPTGDYSGHSPLVACASRTRFENRRRAAKLKERVLNR